MRSESSPGRELRSFGQEGSRRGSMAFGTLLLYVQDMSGRTSLLL